jgi:hypothetical protein
MPRQLVDDFLAGQLLRSLVVRGKCRYDRHESVRLVGDEWWGESSHSAECALAPAEVCATCSGSGQVPLTPAEEAAYDGQEAHKPAGKPCPPCMGKGFVPGPHWPYRHPKPPPLRSGKS